ncbi:MAG TPA: hypothetical protein VEJ67_10900 [Candidatus Cybelea sp.]|nr:hypothetical protein [Candidatus Cybelea sp.]
MSAETKKVLEMLAAGKISEEDAERLLDKLSGGGTGPEATTPPTSGTAATNSAGAVPRLRFVRIQIDRPGREGIDMRVPISGIRGGRHWMAFLPIRLADKLHEYGLDFGCLDTMNDEDFRKALDQMNVDIQGRSGKRVRIYAE